MCCQLYAYPLLLLYKLFKKELLVSIIILYMTHIADVVPIKTVVMTRFCSLLHVSRFSEILTTLDAWTL